LTADQVEEGGIVFILVSGSAKGLGGSTEFTQESENARAEAFATAAQENKLKIVVLHTGGSSRRGALTDGFLSKVLPQAELCLVVNTTANKANQDGFFDLYNPYFAQSVTKMVDTMKPLFEAAA
ncbi:MAG: DUF6305 family protein, partial [Corallococcus sp.]|nr:DUF6305 family protein [Corallococcus sp.]